MAVELLAPCPFLPQFPQQWRVKQICEVIEADHAKIEQILELAGAEYDRDGQAWLKVPYWAEEWRLKWIESQRMRHAWHLLWYATDPYIVKELRAEKTDELKEEIGEDWFKRAVMPRPFSMR